MTSPAKRCRHKVATTIFGKMDLAWKWCMDCGSLKEVHDRRWRKPRAK